MEPLRLAIVGAGAHATRRIYPYIGAAGARLVGVCDLDAAKAERNASLFGGHVYTDMGQMLDEQTPDGVIICTGPEGHAALAPLSLERGIPTYTEKPPAPSAAAALDLAKLAREKGVLLTCGFKKRYTVAYSRARQFLDEFDPRDWYQLSIDYASSQYTNDSARTSFLLDFCIHCIDLSGWLFGDVAEVYTAAKGQDAYSVAVTYRNGAVGSLAFNCGRSFWIPTEEVEISIRGGNFMTVHNSSSWRIARNSQCAEWREPPTFTSSGDSGNDTGHLAEIVDFLGAIREGRTTRSNIAESYKSMVLYEAIACSAVERRIVEVAYDLKG